MTVILFPGAGRHTAPLPATPRPVRDEIYIWPSCTDGGSWDVLHAESGGDHPIRINNFFSFDDAERFAKQGAIKFGARLCSSDGDDS
jgi:hypothetical protein